MIKFLYNIFFWVPILGGILKALYIAQLVKNIKARAASWTPSDDLQNDRENLDAEIEAEAEKFVDTSLEELSVDGVIGLLVKKAVLKTVISSMRRGIVG